MSQLFQNPFQIYQLKLIKTFYLIFILKVISVVQLNELIGVSPLISWPENKNKTFN